MKEEPPQLVGSLAANNQAITSKGFTMWPHLFTVLAREHAVSKDFLVTLLYLWDATVGSIQHRERPKDANPQGRISLSQIPVRHHQRDKWLLALIASGFFRRIDKAGPSDKKGSLYEYENETTPEEWRAFFAKAGFCEEWSGDSLDDMPAARFAFMFRRRGLGLDRWKDKPQEPYVAPRPEERKNLREFVARRKKEIEEKVRKKAIDEKVREKARKNQEGK